MPSLLPAKPKIRPYFDIIFVDDRRCQLRAGDDTILVLGGNAVSELLPQLFRCLDGSFTVSGLVEACKDRATEEDLMMVLTQLNEEGILEDAGVGPPSTITAEELDYYASQLLFFSHFAGNKYEYQAKLKDSRVAIIGLESLGTTVLSSLARLGIGHIVGIDNRGGYSVVNTHGPSSEAVGPRNSLLSALVSGTNPSVHFTAIATELQSEVDVMHAVRDVDIVVVADDRPQPLMYQRINRVCLAQNIPWIIAGSLNSIEGIVGPLFVPHETCCYNCYERRIKSNLAAYEESIAFEDYLKKEQRRPADYGHLAPFAAMIGNLVALEIIKHLTQFASPETYGSLFSINFLTLRTELHDVLKLPRCSECGPSAHIPPRALWSE